MAKAKKGTSPENSKALVTPGSEFPSRQHQFKPGQSGNPGGRPKAATLAMEALEDKTGELMKKAIELALDGDRMLLMFLLPYKLGRPSHKLELTGKGGNPIKVSAVREQLADRLARLLVKDEEPEDAELVDE